MITLLLFFLVSTLAFPTTAVAFTAENPLRVQAAEQAAPGGVLRILVDGSGITDVDARVVYASGRSTDAGGAVVAASGRGLDRWQVLLGIDHTVSPGHARLETVVFSETGARRFHRRLLIVSREFPSEEILLDTAMTALRRSDDPRRIRESRELWELIHRVDPRGGYEMSRFEMPLEQYRRTSEFGLRRTFVYADGQIARTYHNGLDLAAPTGTPVFAPARGRVVMAKDRFLTGGTVILEHQPGVYSLYYHLHSIDVEAGRVLRRNELLGTVGATGLATGPHLHWEVRVGGVAVDPELFVRDPLVDTSGIAGALSTIP